MCVQYQLLTTQLCLASSIADLPFDADPPHLSLIPASVTDITFLHIGDIDLPMAAGMLTASLLYLCVCVEGSMNSHHQLLLPALPASLERLRLNSWLHELQAGVWPAGLRALHLGDHYRPLQPHVLPSSLLHLSLANYALPLALDVLPSSLAELHIGSHDHRLPPGELPASLRNFSVGWRFVQPLQMRSLPERLLFLGFGCEMYNTPKLPRLQPGVLPSTLLGIDLADRYDYPLSAGIIPSSVRWVRLWSGYRDEHIEAALPAHAECVW